MEAVSGDRGLAVLVGLGLAVGDAEVDHQAEVDDRDDHEEAEPGGLADVVESATGGGAVREDEGESDERDDGKDDGRHDVVQILVLAHSADEALLGRVDDGVGVGDAFGGLVIADAVLHCENLFERFDENVCIVVFCHDERPYVGVAGCFQVFA